MAYKNKSSAKRIIQGGGNKRIGKPKNFAGRRPSSPKKGCR